MARFETTVRVPVDVVYGFWRNVHNYPYVLSGVERVEERGNRASHWVAMTGPTETEFDAELKRDERNRLIAWRAIDGNAPFVECRVELHADGDVTKIEFVTEETPTSISGGIRLDSQKLTELIVGAYTTGTQAAETTQEDQLGSSMGATTEDDLQRIASTGDSVGVPSEVDDPATRYSITNN